MTSKKQKHHDDKGLSKTRSRGNSYFSLSLFHFSLFIYSLFFLLAWAWSSWWMGDVFCIARERSFFATDETLMHFLWQQSFGSVFIFGRALLTLYKWPIIGGLVVALLLTGGTWLVGYCLRLRPGSGWHWISFLPALAWMCWTAWKGLNMYYQAEPGCVLGVLLLGVLVCGIDAFVIWTFKGKAKRERAMSSRGVFELITLSLFALPLLITHFRHPYLRPLTRMEMQMMEEDWNGMAETARANAKLSYRPLAAYYAIALVQNGHLTDQLFDIRLDYDSLYVTNVSGGADVSTSYYLIDCDYHAGLFRPATHRAVEQLTVFGPSIYVLKHLTRLALLDHDWEVARKYLFILNQTPFEGEWVRRYEAMLDKPEAVDAEPVFAKVRMTEPVSDAFEGMFQEPTFLGYTCVLTAGRSREALMQSLMACLYSKRMPDFLLRCQPLVGTTPPRTIAEGLVTQSFKEPDIIKAFPQLKMSQGVYQGFLRNVQPYMQERARGGVELFDQYHGYYPYYYFFGNLKSTRKSDDKEKEHSKAGVN